MKKIYLLVFVAMLIAQITRAQTYHSLAGGSFTQNWTTTTLITTDDIWTGVPSIIGYRGDDITGSTGVDPQTLLGTGTITLDVNANRNDPNTFGTGGVTEFDGIPNPVVALQGSGTADAPNLIIYLNSSGRTAIRVQYNVRDIDGSADNAIQQVALQYRIGNTGNFTNVPAGYIADATTGGSATQVTAIDVTLPAACDNQSELQVRIMTTNAVGNDEWIGIDDIDVSSSVVSVSASASAGISAAEPATNGTFTLSISPAAPAGGTTISYTLSGTATIGAGNDYTDPQSGSITVAGGATSATINMNVLDDALAEPTELITLSLTSATNGVSVNSTAISISITDNESTQIAAYNFNGCTATLSDGFTQLSVTGAGEVWSCTTFGRDAANPPLGSAVNGVQMNGFNAGNQLNEDWLISPSLNLTATTVPLLSFYSRTKFAGEQLKLLVSTNYVSGNPTAGGITWTEIDGRFPLAFSDRWTLSQNINLSAFKAANVHFAFKYNSATTSASRITLDDMYLLDVAAAEAPVLTINSNLLDFRFTSFGSSSSNKSFTFWANDLSTSITLTAPANFQLSKDGSSFSNSIVFTTGEALNTKLTVFARYTPAGASESSFGNITFSSTGVNQQNVLLKGNSYPAASTLNIVNWNLEWFGSTGQGPTNEALQLANAETVMEFIDADIFAMSEIVDIPSMTTLVNSLGAPGTYSYTIADFCSNGTTAGACATSQKVAFVYKTSVVSGISARGLLRTSTNPDAGFNWASGRFPYLVTAAVTKNGNTRNINFILVHGKAGDTQDDKNRRQGGSREMKDTLDASFSDKNIMILGDFNDDLDVSIYKKLNIPNPDTASSYDDFVKDSTDADHYKSVSLPLSAAKLHSTFGNGDVIDHVMLSNEMASGYIPYSATLYNDIESLTSIANYNTTTSDHYPVMTRFLLLNVLPVSLTNFTAIKEGQQTRLKWTTTQEINTREFVIERSSNGFTWKTVAIVPAAGNSNSPIDYSIIDAIPAKGINLYRLKSIDLDDKFEYSAIRRINFDNKYTYSIYPNPTSDVIQIIADNASAFNANVQILNTQSQVLISKQINTTNQPVRVNVSALASGFYFIRIITPDGTINVQKFTKH